jgi:hypothetical protein
MVFIADSEDATGAPVDELWKYLQSDADHGESHKGRRI